MSKPKVHLKRPEQTKEPLNRHDLDSTASGPSPCCGEPYSKDHPLVMAAVCHNAGIIVTYWDGLLSFYCRECKAHMVDVKVDGKLI